MFNTVFSGARRLRGVVLAAAIFAGLAACASPPEGDENAPGAVEGELRVVSVSGVKYGSSTIYMLRVPGSEKDIPLVFDTDPNLSSETTLRVWGEREGDSFHVTRHFVVESETDPELDRLALIGQPTTERTMAWVQMNINGGGVTQTEAEANRLIFDRTSAGPRFGTATGDKSLAQYYDEQSYGMLHLTGAVEGPLPYTGNVCPNNFDPPANAMRDAIMQMGRTYDHYFLFWGTDQGCGAGWGAQGTKTRPGRYVWLNHATFCTATAQEIGHNFGMMHASTTDCGTTTIMSNTMSGCTSSEYGNPMTVMGGGCRHLNAVEKWYEGWLLGCNGVTVQSTQTFTLFPIAAECNGLQVIKIPFPSSAPMRQTSTDQSNGNVTLAAYYLEYRVPTLMDTGIAQGVYVHLAPNVPAANQNGPRTFLLDMQPSNNAFSPMTVGQTFDDPAGGVSFTLNSQDTTSASITVTVSTSGNNTCIDGSTLQGGGLASCGATGGTGGMGGSAGMGGRGGAGAGGMGGRGGAGAGGMGNRGGMGGVGAGGMAGDAGMAGGGSGGIDVGGAGGASPGGAGGAAGVGLAGSAGVAPGGATSTGGAPMTGGVAGASTTGGSAGAVTNAGTGPVVSDGSPSGIEDSGCGCRIAGGSDERPTRSASLVVLAFGVSAMVARRRRRSKIP